MSSVITALYYVKTALASTTMMVVGGGVADYKKIGAVPDNAGMCYWIGDEEESIEQGEAG